MGGAVDKSSYLTSLLQTWLLASHPRARPDILGGLHRPGGEMSTIIPRPCRGAGGANAPSQIFVVQLLPKTPIHIDLGAYVYTRIKYS